MRKLTKRPFDTIELRQINSRIARLKHQRLGILEHQLNGKRSDGQDKQIAYLTLKIAKTKTLREEWLKWALGKHYIPPDARYHRWPRKDECLICWRNQHGRHLNPAEMVHVQRHRPI